MSVGWASLQSPTDTINQSLWRVVSQLVYGMNHTTLEVAVVGIELVGVRTGPVKLEVLVLDVKSRPDILVHRVAQTHVLFFLAGSDDARMLALHILPCFLNDEARTEGR